jgi:hypothetical protein
MAGNACDRQQTENKRRDNGSPIHKKQILSNIYARYDRP